MRYFIVYAHPEPRSLNGALKDHAVAALRAAGHEVEVSDLYTMGWKAAADGSDFVDYDPAKRLVYASASNTAFTNGTQTPDIAAEQEKLLRADVVVLQFPLWWYGMPAILKGWIDRVYANGFTYGVGQHGGGKWGNRFGEGRLSGRRAMLAVTAGGRREHYTPRGVNGFIDDLLFPITHGVLFYPGMTVLPSLVFYEVHNFLGDTSYDAMFAAYTERLLDAANVEPIPFRSQNGGDYDDRQVLRPGIEGDAVGLAVHQSEPSVAHPTLLLRAAS
jgi:NAD(P)H dehydrogenase (quinone)